jgi:hypothetical protein
LDVARRTQRLIPEHQHQMVEKRAPQGATGFVREIAAKIDVRYLGDEAAAKRFDADIHCCAALPEPGLLAARPASQLQYSKRMDSRPSVRKNRAQSKS